MAAIIRNLWEDEAGFLVASELVLVSTILVLSMVVGMTSVSHAINHELVDIASAYDSVNQSYRYDGLFGPNNGGSYGSDFEDSSDYSGGLDIVSGHRSRRD
jgi:hypothetical protein